MILLYFIRLGLAVKPPAHGGEIDADLLSKPPGSPSGNALIVLQGQ